MPSRPAWQRPVVFVVLLKYKVFTALFLGKNSGLHAMYVMYAVVMICTPFLLHILQDKEKKPLKEGVQDMLVKHHLFSWDIDG